MKQDGLVKNIYDVRVVRQVVIRDKIMTYATYCNDVKEVTGNSGEKCAI